jgi:hypothetical protein
MDKPLAPPEARQGDDRGTRTPHSVFFYALGYTGWVGVVLFAILQVAILRLLWRSYRITGQAAGLAFWVMAMARASFEEGFEAPFRAIPFYLLMGMSMAPALGQAMNHGAAAGLGSRHLVVDPPVSLFEAILQRSSAPTLIILGCVYCRRCVCGRLFAHPLGIAGADMALHDELDAVVAVVDKHEANVSARHRLPISISRGLLSTTDCGPVDE